MKKLMVVVLLMIIGCAFFTDSFWSRQASGRTEKTVIPKIAGPSPVETRTAPQYDIAGYSSRGHAISMVTISPPHYNKTILLTFAMHGFEDGWDYDGGSLVQIANDVIAAFTEHPAYLNQNRLIVIPCVNPDGLMRYGDDRWASRCNGQGIDINRDFDYLWKYCGEAKYHTGDTPFATPEANLLREVVLDEKPDLVIDFHGWLNGVYGDEEIGRYFNDVLAITGQDMNNVADVKLPQTFVGWAGQHTRAVMVEYPHPANAANINNMKYSRRTIGVIQRICQGL